MLPGLCSRQTADADGVAGNIRCCPVVVEACTHPLIIRGCAVAGQILRIVHWSCKYASTVNFMSQLTPAYSPRSNVWSPSRTNAALYAGERCIPLPGRRAAGDLGRIDTPGGVIEDCKELVIGAPGGGGEEATTPGGGGDPVFH